MARIISKVDPTTGKRMTLARVEGKTFQERNESLAGALGVAKKKVRGLSNTEVGNKLAPDFSSFAIPLNRMNGISTPAVVPNRPIQTADIGLDSKIQGTLDTAEEQRQAQLQQQKQKEEMSFENYLKAKIESPTLEEISVGEYAKDGGVDALAPELSRINNELIAERENLRLQEKELMKNAQGMETSGLNAEVNRLRTESYDRQAALAVTQLSLQGQYDSAKDIADRAAQAKYSAQQRYLDALDMAYERDKANWSRDEQRAYEEAQEERRNKAEQERNDKSAIDNLAIEYLKQGGSASTAQKIMGSKTLQEAIGLSGGVFGSSAGGAPTVKTINGVDMQWNPSTQQWETITAQGIDELSEKTINQLDFVLGAAENAEKLAFKSGSGLIDRTISGAIGNVKIPFGLGKPFGIEGFGGEYQQLEAYTNSLKTNMLTLATDPSIKKFFGPQMSNADVLLMTSAGTTLNPEKQSPAQLREEITRIKDFVTRAKEAVTKGREYEMAATSDMAKPITAPDGTQVIIID